MNPILQPRIYTFYFFSLYFHGPTDPPDRPTYLVFFPARLGGAITGNTVGRISPFYRRGKGVNKNICCSDTGLLHTQFAKMLRKIDERTKAASEVAGQLCAAMQRPQLKRVAPGALPSM